MRKSQDHQADFERCKSMLSDGATTEDLITFLKEKGYTQGPSVFLLQRLGLASGAAKKAVIESAAWRDQRAATEELHEEIDKNFGSKNRF